MFARLAQSISKRGVSLAYFGTVSTGAFFATQTLFDEQHGRSSMNKPHVENHNNAASPSDNQSNSTPSRTEGSVPHRQYKRKTKGFDGMRDPKTAEEYASVSQVDAWIDDALSNDDRIKNLVRSIERAGKTEVPREFFQTVICESNHRDAALSFPTQHSNKFLRSAMEMLGAQTPTQIFVCANIVQKPDISPALSHELVHAYDYTNGDFTAKSDQEFLEKQACSEIRAANLSGQCDGVADSAQRDVCIKRSAMLSVADNRRCSDHDTAADIVNAQFPVCKSKVSPFR